MKTIDKWIIILTLTASFCFSSLLIFKAGKNSATAAAIASDNVKVEKIKSIRTVVLDVVCINGTVYYSDHNILTPKLIVKNFAGAKTGKVYGERCN